MRTLFAASGAERNADLFRRYREWFQWEFTDVDGAVLGLAPGTKPERSTDFQNPVDRARHEVMENHVHMEFRIGITPRERWQNSLNLACCLMEHWKLKLQTTFPGREFVFFIYNELSVPWTPGGLEEEMEIHPTIRFWSRINDPEGELFQAYRVDEAEPDLIQTGENSRVTFVPASEVFVRSGAFRRSFVRRIAVSEAEDE